MKVIIRILISCGIALTIQMTGMAQDQKSVSMLEPVIQTGHSSRITSIAFSADGALLASASEDKTVKLWDPRTGRELRTLSGNTDRISSIDFSPDGKLAGGSQDGMIIIWNVYSGETLRRIKVSDISDRDYSPIESVAFSPDGKTIASTGSNNEIKLWDVATGKEVRTLVGHTRTVLTVAFSPDGRFLASGSRDATVKLWDVSTGQLLHILRGDSEAVKSVTFSPDGKLLASGSENGKTELWDVTTGRKLHSFGGFSRDIRSVAFSPDNKVLASAGVQGINLWDLATGKELRTFSPAEDVTAIAFSPDAQFLAHGDGSAQINLWDVASGAAVLNFANFDQTDWVITTPDGLFDGSTSGWNRILWRFSSDTFSVAPAEAYFNELYYPGLLGELLSGRKLEAPEVIAQKDLRQPKLKFLQVTSASPNSTITSRLAKVEIEIESPAGVRDVRLFRDGALVHMWKGELPLSDGKTVIGASIPVVAGENRLTAYGFNRDNIKSSDVSIVVNGAESLRRPGTFYVLAVGVSQYSNPRFNIRYAVPDAQAFSSEVSRQQSKLGNYGRTEVLQLYDAEATKANILRTLTQLAEKAQPEDALFIYLSGHGTAQRERFYFIPYDMGYTDERAKPVADGLKDILANSISDLELASAIEPIYAGQLLLVIDASSSGAALDSEENRRGPMNSKGLAQLAYDKGIYVLTSSQGLQTALEFERLARSVLSYALIQEGITDQAADFQPKDGQITLREWLGYAVKRVPELQRQVLNDVTSPTQTAVFESRSTPGFIQAPRTFYRREIEARPLIVAEAERPSRK